MLSGHGLNHTSAFPFYIRFCNNAPTVDLRTDDAECNNEITAIFFPTAAASITTYKLKCLKGYYSNVSDSVAY